MTLLSIPGELWSCAIHVHNIKVKSYSGSKKTDNTLCSVFTKLEQHSRLNTCQNIPRPFQVMVKFLKLSAKHINFYV